MPLPQLPDIFIKPNGEKPMELNELYVRLGLKTLAAKEFLELSLRHVILFDHKQLDYGPKNISSFGTFGVVVRMNDKFERIKTLFNFGRRKRAVNESIRDTFSDVHVYALIALMLEQGVWPTEEPPKT